MTDQMRELIKKAAEALKEAGAREVYLFGSNKLKKQAAVELEQLNILLRNHRPLIEKVTTEEPDAIEISALAAMLHAFYAGIENIFKRVKVELNEDVIRNEFWHREPMDSMAQSGTGRPGVISLSLRKTLRGDLDFRHVFRQAYTFNLRWEKMAGLVQECEKIWISLNPNWIIFSNPWSPG